MSGSWRPCSVNEWGAAATLLSRRLQNGTDAFPIPLLFSCLLVFAGNPRLQRQRQRVAVRERAGLCSSIVISCNSDLSMGKADVASPAHRCIYVHLSCRRSPICTHACAKRSASNHTIPSPAQGFYNGRYTDGPVSACDVRSMFMHAVTRLLQISHECASHSCITLWLY